MPDTEFNDAGNAEEMLAEVHVFVGSEEVGKFSIVHGEYIIGRDASCQISIDADLVSRHHARLTFNAFELVIEDLGSSNGVYIDGVQVQLPTRVRLDQEVSIGSARLFINLRESAASKLAAALWDEDLGLGPVREQMEGRKYRVLTTINRGGMGVILQTRDLRIRRTVAMKVMNTKHQFSRENVLRFIDEAQLTGQLEHPNIVPVYELGIDEQGEIFYTMKFVKGTTLDDVLRGIRSGRAQVIGKYPLGALLTIFQKVCDAVAFAHAKGVVHRDLKPENIMIGSFGEVLVMDWGLAKNMTEARRESPVPDGADPAAEAPKVDNLRGFETMHGLIVGTPPYISPEQARGELEKIDARSDIYVLGEILYTILTLRPPVEGGNLTEVVEKILNSRIVHPSSYNQPARSARKQADEMAAESFVLAHCPGRRIPDGLSAVVMKALQVEPLNRYQNVEDLQADIAAFQGGFAPKAERASIVKHLQLFAARHKTEVALFGIFFIVFNVIVVSFFLQLERERDRAKESAKLAADRLSELRGTAPTFYEEAQQFVDDGRFPEALEKIEYAIQQVPNEAAYHNLRGNILQASLRLDEAADAYEEALRLNPKLTDARQSFGLTKKLLAEIGTDEQIKPAILAELSTALLKQGRRTAADNVQGAPKPDRQPPARPLRDALDKRGMRPRSEPNADGTVSVDFSRIPQPDLAKLRDTPVTGLVLDDTRLADLNALRGLPLQTLSLNHTLVRDLAPLAGMKIEQLSLTGCRFVRDLEPLRGMPLQTLALNRTAVTDLAPLTQSPLRELNLEGCAGITDLRPLMDIATLEGVLIPAQCRDIGFLRNHPGIRRLSYKKITQPAAEFWAEFDATPAAAPPKPAP